MRFDWKPNVVATEIELNRLATESKVSLPVEYVSLLRKYNGGEGDLALEPMWLQLWSVDQVLEYQGMESIAFRRNETGVSEIVMFDLIAGVESCTKVADDFSEFEEAIGKEYKRG